MKHKYTCDLRGTINKMDRTIITDTVAFSALSVLVGHQEGHRHVEHPTSVNTKVFLCST